MCQVKKIKSENITKHESKTTKRPDSKLWSLDDKLKSLDDIAIMKSRERGNFLYMDEVEKSEFSIIECSRDFYK